MLPRARVAEELGDVDQQHLEELLVLVRVDLEVVEVVAEGLAADGVHPAPEAALQARALVAREVEPARALEELQQRLERRVVGRRSPGLRGRHASASRRSSAAEQPGRSPRTGRTAAACGARRQRARGHPRDEGVLGVLDDHAPAGLSDERPAAPSSSAPESTTASRAAPRRAASERNIGSAAGRTPFSFGPRAELDPVGADQQMVIGRAT